MEISPNKNEKIEKKPIFVGREFEVKEFEKIRDNNYSQILVVYGRRRVGKTTLLHRCFEQRKLIKVEGLENQPTKVQQLVFFERISAYFNIKDKTYEDFANWRELLIFLYDYIKDGEVTVYLEEIQWLAEYSDELISDLKYVWDNYWSKNNKLILILCGSSPSFIINKVMLSKALYNRSQREFLIEELSLKEAHSLLGNNKTQEEVLDAYLAVGGIPEYLKYLANESSVYLGLCRNSFIKNSFFANEIDRIYVSNLAKNSDYKKIIETLALHKAHTKTDIAHKIGQKLGGTISSLFEDLLKCNFIGVYSPVEFGVDKRLAKFYLRDPYLQFFYKLIKPNITAIKNNDFIREPTLPLPNTLYRQWLGYSFERYCLQNNRKFAELLGFSAVRYKVGPLYMRSSTNKAQIDLVYERSDRVLTVCEIKYQQTELSKDIINEFERKLTVLKSYKKASLHKVLICPNGVSKELIDSHYFDRIIQMNELF